MRKTFLFGIVICVLCLAIVSSGCINEEKQSKFTKITDYFYEVTYYDYNDSAMQSYAKVLEENHFEIGCSAVSNGNFTAHNFDYNYCDFATFLIRTTATKDRYATMGLSGWKKDWTPECVEKGMGEYDLSLLPYTIVDGINEKGLVVCENVVPAIDIGFTTGTNPEADRNVLYCCVPRILLDKCATVDECIDYLKQINIYNTDQYRLELHFLISDKNETCLVELINNEVKFSKEHRYMTNYYNLIDKLSEHALGLERYNIISSMYDSANTFDGMKNLMENIRYSRKYDLTTDPFWYSEYHGSLTNDGKTYLSISSPREDFTSAIETAIKNYNLNKRDSSLDIWKTIYTAIYDKPNKSLTLYLNENYEKKFEFSLFS